MTTYQLITHKSAAIKLLTTIETDDHQLAVEKLKDWSEVNGYRLATGPGDAKATCTYMQNTGWFDFDEFQGRADESIQPTKSQEITMNRLRKLCERDSAVAIKHMIDGLLKHESIEDFKLDLDCHGEWRGGLCHGGAATLVLIELLQLNYASRSLDNLASRKDLMCTDVQDLIDFEKAIYYFSVGDLKPIEEYFGLPVSGIEKDWNLQNDTWKDELPKVIYFWEQLTRREYIFVERTKEESWIEAILSQSPSTAVDCLHSMVYQGCEYNKAVHLAADQFRIPAKELDAKYCLQHGITTRA
jgi:hypothetical protein